MTVELEVQRPLIVWSPLWTESIGKYRQKMGLSREPSHQVGGIGNGVPLTGLRLMLPMAAVCLVRDFITEAA